MSASGPSEMAVSSGVTPLSQISEVFHGKGRVWHHSCTTALILYQSYIHTENRTPIKDIFYYALRTIYNFL